MTKLNKNSADEDAVNCLVVGTEDQNIYIVECEAFTTLTAVRYSKYFLECRNYLSQLQINCPATPSFLDASGVYDVEFRILAACRNGYIYLFRR